METSISPPPEAVPIRGAAGAPLSAGRAIFSLAVIALGVLTLVVVSLPGAGGGFGPQARWLPVIPWLPRAHPLLAYLFGTALVACGVAMLYACTRRRGAYVFGALFLLCALILDLPQYWHYPASVPARTGLFEPLALAALAALLPSPAIPSLLERAARYLLALCLVVFGVDHFLALAPIASLVPAWLPAHAFWVVLFGLVFIAAGVSIASGFLLPWGAGGAGCMFALWVVTLHLPRVLGLYPHVRPHNPDEWSSLLIAVALWGGLWALAAARAPEAGGRAALRAPAHQSA
ncbi:MAG TPA: hypothetical protein VE996_13490 [Terriglobales bacterium]|nr:hypothetical protein [Terriglobales bacterium]